MMAGNPAAERQIRSVFSQDEPPADIAAVKQIILARRLGFARQVERVLRVSLERPELVAFGTLKTLADAIGVGQTTVIRAAQSLGFAGFPEYRNVFRAWLAGNPARGLR